MDRGLKLDETLLTRKVVEGETVVGTVREWIPGERISLTWHPAPWDSAATCELNFTFAAARGGGTTISIEQKDWGAS